MLTLFKSWRSERDLKTVEETWDDQFTKHVFTERQLDIMNYFNIRYECNDARDDFSAARKAGKLPDEMPGFLSSAIQDQLDEMYFTEMTQAEISPETFMEAAEEYKEMSRGHIYRLKQMENRSEGSPTRPLPRG